MRRFLLLATFYACAACVSAQDLAQKITYRAEAIPLKTVCEEITQKTGVPIAASGTLNSMIMVIDVRDVSVQELMDQLAEVVEAEWFKESAATRLTRTAAFIRKKEAEAFQRHLAAVTKSQTKIRETLKKAGEFDAAAAQAIATDVEMMAKTFNPEVNDTNRWRRYQQISDKLPTRRLADRIAANLSPELIAAIRQNGRTVYSTSPNRMQKAMPFNVMPDIEAFIREQAIWSDALARIYQPNFEGGGIVDYQSHSIFTDRKKIEETPAKVLLVLNDQDSSQSISLEVRLLNSTGRTITSTSTSIAASILSDPEMGDVFNKKMADLRAASASENPVELNPLAQEFRDRAMQRLSTDNESLPPISLAFRTALLNPEKYDPLRFGITDILFEIAKTKALQLVAAPGDFMISMMGFSGDKAGIKPSEILGMMQMLPPELSPITAEGSWLTGKRGDFSGIREMATADRATYGKIIRQIGQDGRISLDVKCQIALQSASEYTFGSLYDICAPILLNSTPSEVNLGGSNRNMLRLHGLLTRSQKATLANDGRLVIGSLSPEQQQVIYNMVFKSSRFDSGIVPAAVELSDSNSVGQEVPGAWLPEESTELFPNGLPRNGVITATLGQNAIVMVEQSFDMMNSFTQPMDPQSIGFHLAMKDRAGRSQGSDEYYSKIEWKSFRMADQTSWHYMFEYTEKIHASHQLTDTVNKGEKVNSIDALPSETQAAIKKAKDDMVKTLNGQQKPPGGGGDGGLTVKAS
ncbi:MAG: hypothetical protein KF784_13120 [Fimbriimonadaceae bacterium]|nr:hypothetical protein [Fimbriimonadaceae bacterium]